MSVINVTVIDQTLTLTNSPTIASGGVEENIVKFDFDSTWDGMTRVAIFYQDKEHVYRQIVQADNSCIVPKEVTANQGTMFFGVFGAKDDKILTSEVVRYRIVQGAINEDTTPADPTPDIYEQMLQIYNTLKTDFANLISTIGERSGASIERHLESIWEALEYIAEYADTYILDRLNEAISNSSTQGVIDLINDSVIPKFVEVKNKIETENNILKEEINKNRTFLFINAENTMSTQALQYQVPSIFEEFINNNECWNFYSLYDQTFIDKLLIPSRNNKLKMMGTVLNKKTGTTYFSDCNTEISTSEDDLNYYDRLMLKTKPKVESIVDAIPRYFFNYSFDKLIKYATFIKFKLSSTSTGNNYGGSTSLTMSGNGLLLGAFYSSVPNISVSNLSDIQESFGQVGLDVTTYTVDGNIGGAYFNADRKINKIIRFTNTVSIAIKGRDNYNAAKNKYVGIAYISL